MGLVGPLADEIVCSGQLLWDEIRLNENDIQTKFYFRPRNPLYGVKKNIYVLYN